MISPLSSKYYIIIYFDHWNGSLHMKNAKCCQPQYFICKYLFFFFLHMFLCLWNLLVQTLGYWSFASMNLLPLEGILISLWSGSRINILAGIDFRFGWVTGVYKLLFTQMLLQVFFQNLKGCGLFSLVSPYGYCNAKLLNILFIPPCHSFHLYSLARTFFLCVLYLWNM